MGIGGVYIEKNNKDFRKNFKGYKIIAILQYGDNHVIVIKYNPEILVVSLQEFISINKIKTQTAAWKLSIKNTPIKEIEFYHYDFSFDSFVLMHNLESYPLIQKIEKETYDTIDSYYELYQNEPL